MINDTIRLGRTPAGGRPAQAIKVVGLLAERTGHRFTGLLPRFQKRP